MDTPQGDLIAALNAKLITRGIKLEYRDGDLWISARSAEDDQAFELDYGAMVRQLRAILRGELLQPVITQAAPQSDGVTADPLARWESIVLGLKEMMGGDPPAAVPVAQVAIPQPTPGRVKLPPCPRWEGIPVIDARGLSWRARRDVARNKGEQFTELPPYDMRAFGDSNTP
jgi:hypothetical protein